MACPFGHSNTDNEAFYASRDKETENLSYTEYLCLDGLLKNVHPASNVHDEHLFIVVHQVYELWFTQIIFELDSLREIFMSPKVDDRLMLKINTRLQRVVKILTVLVDQIKILETMTPMDFSDFRIHLKSSSGFQSFQFRLIENKLGVLKDNRISYNQQDYGNVFEGEMRQALEESEKSPSVFKLVEAWLERNPGLEDSNICFWQKFEVNCRRWFEEQSKLDADVSDPELKESLHRAYLKNKENFETILVEEKYEAKLAKGDRTLSWKALKGALMIYYYRDELLFHEPYQMMSLLMDIDSLMIKWRSNHVMLVQRMLGTKAGSGGSSGYQYLRATVSDRYKAFLDFFNLSNYLVPREYIPQINTSVRRKLSSVIMPSYNMATPTASPYVNVNSKDLEHVHEER